jgi:hypothetical protein
VALCFLPILFLLVVTVVKPLLLPTSVSLPAAAALLAAIRLAYLSTPPALVAACCVSGLLEALTPLSIIAGAIILFQTMHHTKVLGRAGWGRRLCGRCALSSVAGSNRRVPKWTPAPSTPPQPIHPHPPNSACPGCWASSSPCRPATPWRRYS